MKGFGTDEKALIRTLATKDPLQVTVLRDAYQHRFKRNLIADVKSETSGCKCLGSPELSCFSGIKRSSLDTCLEINAPLDHLQ